MKEKIKISTKRKKQIDKLYESRAVLLMADKKVYVKDDVDLYSFLGNFINLHLSQYNTIKTLKFDLVQKNIYDEYIVKIWIDEDNLFHAEDDCPNENFFEVATQRKIEKLMNAFGAYDEDDIFLY